MRVPTLLCLGLLSASPGGLCAGQEPSGMVLVPSGEFVMGTDEGGYDEGPAHRVHVSAFYIDRHEVTNAQFAEFVRRSNGFGTVEGPWFRYSVEGCLDLIVHYEGRYGVGLQAFDPEASEDAEERESRYSNFVRWRSATAALRAMIGEAAKPEAIRAIVEEQARLPVRGVSWRDAAAYASWTGKRLPTEAEWEKAARGVDGRGYPWGLEWDPGRAGLSSAGGPAPVGSHPQGASSYGCQDMAGNVWEWTADWYAERYYVSPEAAVNPKGPPGPADGRLAGPSEGVDLLGTPRQGRESNTRKVVRGGGWGGPEGRARFDLRTTRRLWSNPSYWHPDVGFRCAKDPVDSSELGEVGQPCLDAMVKLGLPKDANLIGAVDREGGCAILLTFPSQEAIEAFVRERQAAGLPPRAMLFDEPNGKQRRIPLELNVGEGTVPH